MREAGNGVPQAGVKDPTEAEMLRRLTILAFALSLGSPAGVSGQAVQCINARLDLPGVESDDRQPPRREVAGGVGP